MGRVMRRMTRQTKGAEVVGAMGHRNCDGRGDGRWTQKKERLLRWFIIPGSKAPQPHHSIRSRGCQMVSGRRVREVIHGALVPRTAHELQTREAAEDGRDCQAAAGRNAAPVRREGDGVDDLVTAGQAVQLQTYPNVPQPNGAIVATGCHLVAVGGEVDGVDGQCVAPEHLEALPGGDVPGAEGLVAAARREGPLVTRDRHSIHGGHVIIELLELDTGFLVPQSDGIVPAAGDETHPTSGIGDAAEGKGVPAHG